MVALSHRFAREVLRPGDLAVDATAGNGHDTVFLAKCVGEHGKGIAFDIQETALNATRLRAEREQVASRIELIHSGHQDLAAHLQSRSEQARVVMFNLGYLPGGDKSIITRPETTIAALASAFAILAAGGRITIVVYPGHPGGDTEAAAVRRWCNDLPDTTSTFGCRWLTPQGTSPFLFVIDKRIQ